MFDEVSMINPREYSVFMGFSEEEVKELCEQYQVDFTMMREWYNGYHLVDGISIYSPRSVTLNDSITIGVKQKPLKHYKIILI